MKSNFINKTHIEGLLYQHSLELKESGPKSKNPGTVYITGTVEIATDDACLNIVPVHYTYVTALTSQGKKNASFETLVNIQSGAFHSIMANGKETAAKIRIDSAIGLNEFFSDKNGTEELVSVKRNEGGFIHLADSLNADEKTRNTFEADMIITKCIRKEADEERNIPEKVIVSGAIFDFRNSLLPIEFSATNPNAMNYFEGLEASSTEPVITKVWGRQISETIVKTITEESAFGDPEVREITSTRKDFVITGAAKEPYIWNDDSCLTAQELTTLMANRETYLATLKQRNEEYKASKASGAIGATATSPAIGATPAMGNFKF
jgi:hypothetical protein